MKKTFNERIVDEYPEWHNNPFRLTVEEMENPYLILSDFFQMYTLSDARIFLKQLFEDAISATDINPKDHYTLYELVEKLVEAASILYQKENERLV